MSEAAAAPKRPWNRYRAPGQKSPFSTKDVAFIRKRLKNLSRGGYRRLAG